MSRPCLSCGHVADEETRFRGVCGAGFALRRPCRGAEHPTAGRPKQLWMIPEAGHTGSYRARPAEYERRVVDLFHRSLPEKS